MKPSKPAGIYIHIPFCVRKCPYCDFYSVTDTSIKSAFVRALLAEIELVSNEAFNPSDTLYLGGGTPSVLSVKALEKIMRAALEAFQPLHGAEMTMEVNPGTVSPEQLRAYRDLGINRLNIGAQSFDDDNLNFLGRIHSAREAMGALDMARKAGFDNVGMDLIYGLPAQTRKEWLKDLKQAVALEPEHLSCYILTCEPGTPMYRDHQAGVFRPISEDLLRGLFLTTMEFLQSQGYDQYEISNFARSGRGQGSKDRKSRHNLKYWSFAPYLGLGPSAHSYAASVRFWNVRDIEVYIRQIETGKLPRREEILTVEQQIMEAVYLGLRQTRGICLESFRSRFSQSFTEKFAPVLEDFQKQGLVKINRGRCALSREGMLFLDSITAQLLT